MAICVCDFGAVCPQKFLSLFVYHALQPVFRACDDDMQGVAMTECSFVGRVLLNYLGEKCGIPCVSYISTAIQSSSANEKYAKKKA